MAMSAPQIQAVRDALTAVEVALTQANMPYAIEAQITQDLLNAKNAIVNMDAHFALFLAQSTNVNQTTVQP